MKNKTAMGESMEDLERRRRHPDTEYGPWREEALNVLRLHGGRQLG